MVNPFMTEAVIILGKSVDWFLYDNGLRHERVLTSLIRYIYINFHSYGPIELGDHSRKSLNVDRKFIKFKT